ncbi:MAG TPA: alpha/beta hydrolase [Gemmatimonadales bacterium]|nr:alpha/beta hydrolase [Gemmatimonadales bacterium]
MSLRSLRLADVALAWVERGAGEPVVLVHGGGASLRYWDAQLDAFAERYRVVAYSRRYAPPNDNAPFAPDYNARTDARDLAALIEALDLAPVHLVAHSIGAVAALHVATERPALVRTLVVAEPPVLRWTRDSEAGEAAWQRFMARMWRPAADAFRAGDVAGAMRVITDSFAGEGTFDRVSERSRVRLLAGAPDWAAFTLSTAPFPMLERDAVRRLPMPVMLMSAERTVETHRLVDAELARLLPHAEHVVIPAATHDMWLDAPLICRAATLDFLQRHATVPESARA